MCRCELKLNRLEHLFFFSYLIVSTFQTFATRKYCKNKTQIDSVWLGFIRCWVLIEFFCITNSCFLIHTITFFFKIPTEVPLGNLEFCTDARTSEDMDGTFHLISFHEMSLERPQQWRPLPQLLPLHSTEVCFASFLSGGFTTMHSMHSAMAVINPPESKLAKRTSVHPRILFC